MLFCFNAKAISFEKFVNIWGDAIYLLLNIKNPGEFMYSLFQVFLQLLHSQDMSTPRWEKGVEVFAFNLTEMDLFALWRTKQKFAQLK